MSAARGCPDPALPLAALAAPAAPTGGLEPWLAARLPHRNLALCANARAGIRQAADRLDLSPGDEILVPAWNCGSEVDPLLDAGLIVRLYPTGAQGRVHVATLADWIGPETRAVYLTHYFGWPQPEAAAIARLCRERGLPLIEDCALSLLSDGPDGPPGSFGDAAVFCFYKFFPLIGGGALALREDLPAPRFDRPLPGRFQEKALARELSRRLLGQGGATALKARLRRLAGRRPPAEAGPSGSGLPDMPAHYYFDPGFRDARISGVTRRLLARIDPQTAGETRRRNWMVLAAALATTPSAKPLFSNLPDGVVPLAFPVMLNPAVRDEVCAGLQARGIAATPWWSGYHQGLDWSAPDLAPARRLKDGLLALPIHQHLEPGQIQGMADALRRLLDAAPSAAPSAA